MTEPPAPPTPPDPPARARSFYRDDAPPPLARELAPLERRDLSGVLDAVLKAPGKLLYEILEGKNLQLPLLAVSAGCMLSLGVVTGSFSGGPQLWVVPLKLCAGLLASAAICLPSLYVFSCLAGSQCSLAETWQIELLGVARLGLLLVGFAPVIWVFSQSTSSPAFMGALHIGVLVIAGRFGLSLIGEAVEVAHRGSSNTVRVWSVVFTVVVFQMTTFLRPLVGPFDGFALQEKLFFLEHWF